MIPPNTAVSHLFAGMLKRVFVVALRAKEASSAHTRGLPTKKMKALIA